MIDAADQIFVILKHWILTHSPNWIQTSFSALLSAVSILGVFAFLFAITTLAERKGLGRFQNRYGPNRVGPFGLLQPLADGLKSLTKEDVVPRSADTIAHLLAPILLVTATFMGFAVLPFGRNMVAVDLDAGVLYFFAVGAITEVAIFMAGWSSRNKYSLLGAMRAIAQMISYEVPLILSAVPVVMISGSLSTVAIVESQTSYGHIWPHWFVFTPWGLAGFVIFMIAATAESNRSPFDLPEGESEIIAGYYVEYSGFKFALFFLGEYIGLFAISGLAVTLFLGGWLPPFAFLGWLPTYVWFFVKLLVLIAALIWVRGTLPRLRGDQLMNFAWKFMLPLALIDLIVTGLWHFMPSGMWRWTVCAVLILVPYSLLGKGLTRARRIQKRIYRFAE